MKKTIKQYRVVRTQDKKLADKKKKPTQVDSYVSYYELFKSLSK